MATKSALSTKQLSNYRMSEKNSISKVNRGGSIPKAERKEAREFGREIAQNGIAYPRLEVMQGKLKPNVSKARQPTTELRRDLNSLGSFKNSSYVLYLPLLCSK